MEHPDSSTPPAGAPIPSATPPWGTPTAGTVGTPVPTFTPDGPPDPGAVVTEPPTSPVVGFVPEPPRRRRWPMAVALLLIVALTGLSGYLWWVNTQWVEQNSTLRDEASSIGELLAAEQALAAQQAAELDNAASELESVTSRVSDLANEEANAIDDRAILEDIADALVNCADNRQQIIEVYRTGRTFVGISRQGRENEVTEACEATIDALDDHHERRDDR